MKQRFIRSYRKRITPPIVQYCEWLRMYEDGQWDLELDRVDDEGLRQTHTTDLIVTGYFQTLYKLQT